MKSTNLSGTIRQIIQPIQRLLKSISSRSEAKHTPLSLPEQFVRVPEKISVGKQSYNGWALNAGKHR